MKKIFIILILGIFVPLFIISAEVADYTVLTPLPGTTNGATTNLDTYLPGMFKLLIGVGAGLAFLFIFWYGFEYMFSDSFLSKGKARERITEVLGGLLLIISSYAILNSINGNLLKLELKLETPVLKEAPPLELGSATSGGSGLVGCKDATACKYSYVNSKGETIKYMDCSNCTLATGKGLTINTQTINGQSAQINTTLLNKLIATKNTQGTPSFTVTETWPPTVNHQEQGQYNGTSVDIDLPGNPTAQDIKNFIVNASKNNLTAIFEVYTQADKDSWVAKGVPENSIAVVGYISGPHFSIYMR